MDHLPTLDLTRKHSIEAVVDRFKVRADLGIRLAESFETTLRLADGLARVAFMDEPKREELIFSAKFACPICGYSLNELEPRRFSFNNPAGACPTCDGLGVKQFFDIRRLDGKVEGVGSEPETTLREMRVTLRQAQSTLESLELTLGGADEARMRAASTLEELERALKAIHNLVDYIQTHPEAVVQGKSRIKENK